MDSASSRLTWGLRWQEDSLHVSPFLGLTPRVNLGAATRRSVPRGCSPDSFYSCDQISLSRRQMNGRLCAGVELQKIGFNPIAEYDSILGHVRDKNQGRRLRHFPKRNLR